MHEIGYVIDIVLYIVFYIYKLPIYNKPKYAENSIFWHFASNKTTLFPTNTGILPTLPTVFLLFSNKLNYADRNQTE